MKKLILFFLALALFSCKQENNDSQSKELISSKVDNTPLIAGIGDSLIAQQSFIDELNKAKDIESKRLILSKIKYDFDKYVAWKENTTESKNIGKINLKFQNDISNKKKADIYSHIKLVTEKNNVFSDSLTIYKQENYGEALIAVIQYFYIDIDLNIWTLSIIEEESNVNIQSWKHFKIDEKTGKINLVNSKFENKSTVLTTNSTNDNWIGKYTFKRENRDELVTSFDINIKNLNDIDIIYIGDGENPETYKNLKAENVDKDKIKIEFNKKYAEYGIIYIQKIDNQYTISGETIATINPGNDEYTLKKMN